MNQRVDIKAFTVHSTPLTSSTFAFYSANKSNVKDAESILIIKFNTSYSHSKLSDRCTDDLETFRSIPGLLQKYYVTEDLGNGVCSVYIFESRSARAAFWTSELAKQIPARYGVLPDTLRVEIYEMAIVLNDVVYT